MAALVKLEKGDNLFKENEFPDPQLLYVLFLYLLYRTGGDFLGFTLFSVLDPDI